MAFKEYKNIEGSSRVEFTADDFSDLQNHYIKQIIRHTHTSLPANNVKIADKNDEEAPVGLYVPGDDSVLTWEDHVALDHSGVDTSGGQLLARGWTVPTKVRCVIATPIADTTSNLPFPTYNMSPVTINKDLASEDLLQEVSRNRHNPSTYSVYRHYLWIMPMNCVGNIHPSHRPIIEAKAGTVFAFQPLFIHPSNTELLKKIKNPSGTPNFRDLGFVPDYAEEKVWSLTEDSTCWLGGYKPIVSAPGNDISLIFQDYHNEFFQVLSNVNYEELNREYFFRMEKGIGNTTSSNFNSLSDITRLMEAKAIDVTDINAGGGLVRDAINRKINPYTLKTFNFSIDSKAKRIKSSLLDSCYEKNGENIKIFPKGLASYSSINDSFIEDELNVPPFFDDGVRQCLVINAEYGTSTKSFKKLHKGRVSLIYQVIDGYMSIPYEVYSASSSTVLSGNPADTVVGSGTSERVYRDIVITNE